MAVEVLDFLSCETPAAWVEAAVEDLDTLLIDHANCEKKAAATAMSLLYRHVDKTELLLLMSRLAREELLHFKQVVEVMSDRQIRYRRLGPSRYAAGLRRHIDNREQGGLIDILIIGALVEARSCERFDKLLPHLNPELARFYRSLVKSESRHFHDYLSLARRYDTGVLESRLDTFHAIERDLVLSEDGELRFHSGVPAVSGGSAQHRENTPV
ncbi:MAG: tRNA-(ms[2]io[6]A)-hydroxylase [Gammaproteobacteria bacterium]|nr:tRNA-(ms[2]io[6]A)-hydroxylase [Pseudomonadales bacterium]MCP5345992.1 tRNA-(ms[2]io[6]A)-hydroxylase [Pseudomonadales bacterium]